jgi:hypothetical protein
MAFISKSELKQIIKDSGNDPKEVVNSLLKKGHALEGFVERGPQGPVGPQGPQGFTGPRGSEGPQGPQGPMGLRGLTGEPGRPGRDGKDGREGKDGRDGRDGRDGSPDTGDEIIQKINDSEGQIDSSRIKNLPHGVTQIIEHGGFAETQIKAGTNTTVTKDVFGNWVISSTGSSGGVILSATGTVNGSNTVFVFSSAPSMIVRDGMMMRQTSSDGTVNWTGTTTITLAVAPNFDLFGL